MLNPLKLQCLWAESMHSGDPLCTLSICSTQSGLDGGGGEGTPGDVEPAAAGGQELVGVRMGAQEVDESQELLRFWGVCRQPGL